ncbi:MAG: zinc ribbon domain-containing protein [Anaerolineaceae bacterium]|nr:zinc ribbon domain-containing protein [Anaerolineaceae bacterium]
MMDLNPKIDQLTILGVSYQFSNEFHGPRLKVLKADNGSRWSLKILPPALRAQAAEAIEVLNTVAPSSGLQTCTRMMLNRENCLELDRFPELDGALLIPWVDGTLWHSFITHRQPISSGKSLALAQTLAAALKELESKQIAHCRLGGDTILVGGLEPEENARLELINFESLYHPQMPPPFSLPSVSAAYHPSWLGSGLWQVDADRFSAALLLAEILAWSDDRVRSLAYGSSYFPPGELQSFSRRYQTMLLVLVEHWGDKIADLFVSAWESKSLADCPPVSEWSKVIGQPQVTIRSVEIPRRKTTKCPNCGKSVRKEWVVCKYCHNSLLQNLNGNDARSLSRTMPVSSRNLKPGRWPWMIFVMFLLAAFLFVLLVILMNGQ